MAKVLVLSLVLHLTSTTPHKCIPGKITGISCPSSADIVREVQPSIDKLGGKISTVYKTTGDTLASTRILIRDNIANAKNLTSRKFWQTRNLINTAKMEVVRASQKIKACITQQSLELGKIPHGNFISCRGNFSLVVDVRKQIMQLKQVTVELVQDCKRLNPLDSESENFRLCLNAKLIDLQAQLLFLEQNFTDNVKKVVKLTTECVMKESGDVHAKIGAVEGAVRNCKICQ